MKSSLLGLVLIVASALFDSYAAFIVKLKFNEMGTIDYSSFRNIISYLWNFTKSPILLTALATFLLAPALWFLALNKVDLSVGYPVMICFHLIFVMLLGILFLGEEFNIYKAAGTFFILISVYFFYKN